MGTCNDCQAEVNFIPVGLKENGKTYIWSPPLEPVTADNTRQYSVDKNREFCYIVAKVHDCPKRGEAQNMWARAEPIADMWARALVRECPKCGADVGRKCYNLRNGDDRARPHDERLGR